MNHKKLPETAVLMVSHRDYRLSSLSGWVQQFTRGVPAKVPPHVYHEALKAGCEVVEDGATATPEVVSAPVVTAPVVVAETPEEDTQDPREEAIDNAIRILLVRGDEADFKNDGTPKAASVITECAALEPKPTALEVSDRFVALQDDISLAED